MSESLSSVRVPLSDIREADGSAKSWMEPQHDGPAIEANTILRFLRTLIRKGVKPAEIGRVLAIERDVTPKGVFENSIVKLHADHILGVWNKRDMTSGRRYWGAIFIRPWSSEKHYWRRLT